VLLWNGGGVAGAAIRNFARQNGIPTGFLEIANIAGKLFVDPEGVNARASIAREPDRLLHYPADPARFEAWRAAYLETKLNSHIIPQAMSVQPVNWWRLADLAGAWLGVPDIAMESLNAKFQRIVLRRGAASAMLPEDSFDPRATDYVFFPLQLSNDTNVVLNSSVGNEQALKKAAAEAHARGCRLVVKLHPAETDRNFVRRIGALKQSIDFLVSRANTFVLIANAQLVVTINSTVGIEARLLGRPVEVYGRALYGGFSDAHLRHYLLGWLLDIDAFGGGAISPESAAAILERAGAETGSPHAHAWSRNR
jgi:capsular polysaccharide export protein